MRREQIGSVAEKARARHLGTSTDGLTLPWELVDRFIIVDGRSDRRRAGRGAVDEGGPMVVDSDDCTAAVVVTVRMGELGDEVEVVEVRRADGPIGGIGAGTEEEAGMYAVVVSRSSFRHTSFAQT